MKMGLVDGHVIESESDSDGDPAQHSERSSQALFVEQA